MNDLQFKNHLTDEQFAACLDGTPIRPELEAHLAACAQCRIEMHLFELSMKEFKGAAFDWSRAQPVPSLRPVVLSQRTWSSGTGLHWAMAAMLFIGIGAPLLIHTERQHHTKAVLSAISTNDDSDGEIAKDNALLKEVNLALATTEPSPFQQYDLPPGSQIRSTLHAQARAR